MTIQYRTAQQAFTLIKGACTVIRTSGGAFLFARNTERQSVLLTIGFEIANCDLK